MRSASPAERTPVTTLRGAPVDVDGRRVARFVAVVAWLGVLVTAVVLVVAGVHRNGQIRSLQTGGVPVVARVATCSGLLGGSGSNAAGYVCSVSFELHGHRYLEGLPGTVQRAAGSPVAVVVVPSRPALVEVAGSVARERAGDGAFVLPTALAVADLLAAGWWVRRRSGGRRRRAPVLPA